MADPETSVLLGCSSNEDEMRLRQGTLGMIITCAQITCDDKDMIIDHSVFVSFVFCHLALLFCRLLFIHLFLLLT